MPKRDEPVSGLTPDAAAREHAELAGRCSVALDPEALSDYNAVLIATDHDGVDYASVADRARLIVDTRNACGRLGLTGPTIVKA